MIKISVVIPTLNEAPYVDRALRSVARQHGPHEIIVADGGSTDATRERAAERATVLVGDRGRARQMNAGAAVASGEVLLFLHADTQLPAYAFRWIRATLASSAAEAGLFRLRFDVETPLLRFYAWCTRFPLPRIAFGDRALFVRRRVFEAVGGFPEVPIFEDLELVRLLDQRGGLRFVPACVVTSARRFERQGPLRQQILNLSLWIRYVTGGDLHRLASAYTYDRDAPD